MRPDTARDLRLFTRVGWARVALTVVALLVVWAAPDLTSDRPRLVLLLLAVWLPLALAQLAVVRVLPEPWRWITGTAADVAAMSAIVLSVPQQAIGPLLSLTVLVALHALLESYAGGALMALAATAALLVAARVDGPDQVTTADAAVFLATGLAITGLVSYGIESSRSVAHSMATSYDLAQDRLALSLESAEMGLWEWDIPGDIVEWSEQTLSIFGCDEPPADAAAFLSLVHPEDREMMEQQIQAALRDGGHYHVQHRVVVGDRTRWLIGKGRVLQDEDGNPVRLIGVVTDVSAEREQQLQLERSRRLETVSGLAGGFAHDFNNVLGVIMMTAEVLRRSDLDTAQRERVEFLIEAARRGAAVSDKLLTFARREPGHPVPVRLEELVGDVEPMLARALRADISLTLDLATPLPPVLADPDLLEQALLNLAVNARDAMPDGGSLRVSARSDESDGETFVVLEVSDNGVGMTETVAERAMEPFFTTKGPTRGTGLGLASVYSTVSALGGRVEIDTKVGAGTTVRLFLPSTQHEPTGRDLTLWPSESVASARILVVDDDEDLRSTLCELLSSDGHEVLMAADGQEALRLVEQQPEQRPDLVVTDIVMPELSGPNLAAELKRRGVVAPVLFMTGYVDQEPELDGGAESLLRKPFTAAELRRAVTAALNPGVDLELRP